MVCLRICTGFKEVSFRETHLWEHFGQADKIALITCLKKLNVSGSFLKNGAAAATCAWSLRASCDLEDTQKIASDHCYFSPTPTYKANIWTKNMAAKFSSLPCFEACWVIVCPAARFWVAATCGLGRRELASCDFEDTPKIASDHCDSFRPAKRKTLAISAAEWLWASSRPPWSLRLGNASFVCR